MDKISIGLGILASVASFVFSLLNEPTGEMLLRKQENPVSSFLGACIGAFAIGYFVYQISKKIRKK